MKKTKTTKRAFTLVELLAVIVILAIILVIAVPQIMDTIEKSKKGSMESSAKLVASEVELKYNTALTTGDTFNTTGSCMSYGNLDDDEYASCTYTIDANGKASVILTGKTGGKFDGYTCTDSTKIEATCTKGSTSSIPDPVAFATDSWETIQKAVQDNNTSVYSVGDTKCIALDGFTTTNDNGCSNGEFKVRIANMSTPAECAGEGFSQTACGFVVEFVDIIDEYSINTNDNWNYYNVGGWPSSKIRAYLNGVVDPDDKTITYSTTIGDNDEGTIYNALPSDLRNIIVETTVVSGHGSTSEETNFTSTYKLYLLSSHEIWFAVAKDLTDVPDYMRGADLYAKQLDYFDTGYNYTRQLDYYSDPNGDGNDDDKVTSNSYSVAIKEFEESASIWYTRAAFSRDSSSFIVAGSDGSWSYAINSKGVSPAFRIG